jgi:uncharacterized protein YdhG (YjbR/CyaY superfamily)
MPKPKTVNEYIASMPVEYQDKLHQMRQAIKSAAPDAEEKISYSMPYYGYKGRLAYFQLSKNHLGLYIPPPVVADFAKELKSYKTATSTIQFPLSEPLPIPLIKKMVQARAKYNDKTK